MSSNADREMLEMAAKAAGIEILEIKDRYTPIYALIPMGGRRNMPIPWAPNSSDADAFRLAVKLGLCVGKAVHAPQRFACPQTTDDAFYEEEGDDPAAATRLAIVRAAAQIGKEMK